MENFTGTRETCLNYINGSLDTSWGHFEESG